MNDKALKEEYFDLHKRQLRIRREMDRQDSAMFDFILRNQEAVRKLVAAWGQAPFEDGSKIRSYIDYYNSEMKNLTWGLEGIYKRYLERRQPNETEMTQIYQRAGEILRLLRWTPTMAREYVESVYGSQPRG
jgi:hypothetical protein